ncbi:N,N-dimethylformamidase beta subunit family domain-containing protein [Vulgatibacter incomptus]|uniref:N,N-dimethylformamidase beta subunit-like C-terminal domain-containing protein n=1 Tax=Vulgatibacter incomptus TaxID=1391653 RepID=A0A0K1PIJ7_9BACT|nr:N,N-dimethylformamidase beta subunit family domain-containing protein [Vulgatibacter incomptus]AKU92939.1 hypothetical protein AKJ08_3326 [Vulgatibacter incomptus]
MRPLAPLAALAALLLAACAGDPPGITQNTVVSRENALPGNPDWNDGPLAVPSALAGYADHVSAVAGDSIALQISSSPASNVSWTLYRLGWYGGAGARQLASGSAGSVGTQPSCPVEGSSGLVRCAWSTSARMQLPADALSGLYLFKLVREDGRHSFVPLVVKDDRSATFLFQSSVTTWQAYNPWGGTSLYVDRTGSLPFGRAVKVSFDRPYETDYGSGEVLRWEVHFARFMERYGYDVSYTTNLDVSSAGLGRLSKGQAFLSVGHDEYWTLAERDAIEAARDRGVSTLFFGANTGYWKIRLEDSRTIVSYKSNAFSDPEKGAERTGLWRARVIGRPENALVGVMYESWMKLSSAWVVSDDSHFLYRGTGLHNRDTIPRIVGYEYDRTFDNGNQPSGLSVMARSPVLDIFGKPGVSEAGSYRAASGALVFSSASIEWSYGLGQPGIADPRVERMTANVLDAATKVGIPAGVGSGPIPEAPRREDAPATVSTVGKGLEAPTGVAELPDGVAVADPRANRIFLVKMDGTTSVIAGDGVPSSDAGFDQVPGAQARFNFPTSVVADEAGVLYVADTSNHCIRRIAPDGQREVTTLAGSIGQPGMVDATGSGARFSLPMGLAIDPRTGLLLVADADNGRIRAVDRHSGATTTVAGGGTNPADGPGAQVGFAYPTAVAAGPDGTIYVVDTEYAQLRSIGTDPARSVVTLVRGPKAGGDGTGDVAGLAAQGGAAWMSDGLFLTEPTRFQVRKVVPGADASSTRVYTVAGGRYGAADGRGHSASFGMPVGLGAGRGGALWVTDAGNGSLRKIVP